MRWSWAFHIDSVPFTRDVIDGTASLGGSESACVGLARALAARGHDVHVFTTQLTEGCEGADQGGVVWHPAADHAAMNQFIEWDVFVALRQPHVFGSKVRARYRVLWNQDLMTSPQAVQTVMALGWAYDRVAYVSAYHRQQWEGMCPELAPLGWVTRNGYDPALVPVDVVKVPHRAIHVSRPERGLGPLLEMWPAVRAARPDAELHLCRYSSMYDALGWGTVCASYDAQVAAVNEAVGGITYLGELGKPALYQAIAKAAVMWYPGVVDFAETSCIAAIEAQANGTPFVGSFKGALPETVPGGLLLDGDAYSPEYQRASVSGVLAAMEGCARRSVDYRTTVQQGQAHVTGYTYAALAAAWESSIVSACEARRDAHPLAVVRQALYFDDHTAAQYALETLSFAPEDAPEVARLTAFCQRVIDGRDQTSDQYAAHAMDVDVEVAHEATSPGRLSAMVAELEGVTSLLDVACGNGALALLAAQASPTLRVTGVDYAHGNIDQATEAAARAGVSDRVRFVCASAWDFATQTAVRLPDSVTAESYDAVVAGEILEHVAHAAGFIDHLESYVTPGGRCLYSMPHGPFTSLMPRNLPIHRGHVHHFAHDDLTAVFGLKDGFKATYLTIGESGRGHEIGHWLVTYTAGQGGPARARRLDQRVLTLRPFPRLSVGMITKNAETTITKCLASVYQLADEILIGDTGSTDDTVPIATAYDQRVRVLHLPAIEHLREGFAGARNLVLDQAVGEWFLWIDADEELLLPRTLSKYLDSPMYQGYALRQHHVQIDAPPHFDRPVRLFRRVPSVRFYGCVHEQPQAGDCNTDITPALDATDCPIVHYGYIHEGVRRAKMLHRNLALLQRDREIFPDRELGMALWVREFFNHAQVSSERRQGLTEQAAGYLQECVRLFMAHFSDPAHKLHAVARPFYEQSLRLLTQANLIGAWEMDIGIGGKYRGMGGRALQNTRVWVQSFEEYDRLVQHTLAQARAKVQPPPIDVTPRVRQEVAA